MMDTYTFMLASYIIVLTWWGKVYAQTEKHFNITDFGTVGDGIKDDSQAFTKAWAATCEAKSAKVTLHIPKGKTFMLKPIKFQGPCNSSYINIEVAGKLVAPNALSEYPKRIPNSWLEVSQVDGLTIYGGGGINGNGQVWWNSCNGKDCPRKPTMAIFDQCNNFRLYNMRFFNSSQFHILIKSCTNVRVSHLHVEAPGDSPNTDGIDIASSKRVSIDNCFVSTGDDCVAITDGSRNINVTRVTCGRSHGISIGSLGEGGKNDTVEGVHVSNCTFNGSDNGARIKTWQGGSGFARNITFEDIVVVNSSNPIFIDQFYCPQGQCANKTGAIKISDITFRNIRGTSPSETSILLHCSQDIGCTNIKMEQINITSSIPGKQTRGDCINAQGQQRDPIIPSVDCLEKV